jgi:hypothetical protein
MKADRILEFVRHEIRRTRRMLIDLAADPKLTARLQASIDQLGAHADYITQALEHLHDDIILRSSVSGTAALEIRSEQMREITKADFDLFMQMAQLTRNAFTDSPDTPAKEIPVSSLTYNISLQKCCNRVIIRIERT